MASPLRSLRTRIRTSTDASDAAATALTRRAEPANPIPRPADELDRLRAVWRPPSRLRFPTAVNNTYIGLFYVGTAFLFFLLGGVLALLMRTQLAVAENDFLSQARYNQFCTVQGRS